MKVTDKLTDVCLLYVFALSQWDLKVRLRSSTDSLTITGDIRDKTRIYSRRGVHNDVRSLLFFASLRKLIS